MQEEWRQKDRDNVAFTEGHLGHNGTLSREELSSAVLSDGRHTEQVLAVLIQTLDIDAGVLVERTMRGGYNYIQESGLRAMNKVEGKYLKAPQLNIRKWSWIQAWFWKGTKRRFNGISACYEIGFFRIMWVPEKYCR